MGISADRGVVGLKNPAQPQRGKGSERRKNAKNDLRYHRNEAGQLIATDVTKRIRL